MTVVIVTALVLTALWVKETLAWAHAEGARHAAGQSDWADAALPAEHFRAADDLGSVHAHVLARQAHGSVEPGRAG